MLTPPANQVKGSPMMNSGMRAAVAMAKPTPKPSNSQFWVSDQRYAVG